jgi:hypothetical protein
MSLCGIYGSHTTESCPLNNIENRNLIIKMDEQLKEIANKNIL